MVLSSISWDLTHTLTMGPGPYLSSAQGSSPCLSYAVVVLVSSFVPACASWADAASSRLLDGPLQVRSISPGPISSCSSGGPWTCLSLAGSGGCAQALWERGSALSGVALGCLPSGSSWSPCCNESKPSYVVFMCIFFSGNKGEKTPPLFLHVLGDELLKLVRTSPRLCRWW